MRKFHALSTTILSILLTFVGLATPNFAIAKVSFLEPAYLKEEIRKQIAKQTIKNDFKLYDGDILEGVHAAIKYKYRAEPSYMESYYTRYDGFSIDGSVDPAKWIEEIKAPFGLGFSANSEIVFARQFKNQLDSVKAVPYTLLKFPISSKRAIDELNVGDFVSFQARIGLVVSVGASIPASELFTASGSTYAEIHGDFLIHMFKTEPNKIRVKFIAMRGESGGVSGNVNAVHSTLDITGIRLIDKQITRRVVINPAELAKSLGDNDLFVIDYVFDLSNPEAAAAFDNIMQTKMKFRPDALAAPILDRDDLENRLVTDLTDVEEIYAADKDKPVEAQRIYRVFKGSTDITSHSGTFKFGLNIVRLEKNSYFAQSRILSSDKDENQSHYILDTFSLSGGFKFLFKMFDEMDRKNANLLFLADNEYKPVSLVALVFNRERELKSLSSHGLERFKESLKLTLPESIFRGIQWQDWSYNFTEKVNVNLQHQVTFTIDALRAAEGLTAPEIKERIYGALRKIGIDPEVDLHAEAGINFQRVEIDQIVEGLTKVLNKELDKEERHKTFVKLRDNHLFVEAAVPVLFALIPQDHLEDLVHYKLVLSGRKIERMEFEFGKSEKNPLYDSILYLQGVLNNRSIDLRTYK
jgi:hypothetical protein